jgi:hypothetical protein
LCLQDEGARNDEELKGLSVDSDEDEDEDRKRSWTTTRTG